MGGDKVNSSISIRYFQILTRMLGLAEESLLEYLNWCLLEELTNSLAKDKDEVKKLRNDPRGLATFKKRVELRTNCHWDNENISVLFDRVVMYAGKHYRKKITYDELLRLLVNTPLKCVQCNREPPDVVLHIDHRFPASRGGSSKFENLQFLCAEHNLQKSDTIQKSDIWLKLEFLRPF